MTKGPGNATRTLAARLSRIGMSLAGLATMVSALLAGATVWLLLTDPIAMVGALDEGSLSAIVRKLAEMLSTVLTRALQWL